MSNLYLHPGGIGEREEGLRMRSTGIGRKEMVLPRKLIRKGFVTARKLLFAFPILVILMVPTGCQERVSRDSEALGKYSQVGNMPTFGAFRERFNQESELKIGKMQLLKDNKVMSSFLYSFHKDLAVSVLALDGSNALVQVTMIGVPGEESTACMENMIKAYDPNLSARDRKEIIAKLNQGDQTGETEIERNGVLYRLEGIGQYVKFSAETPQD